ncbi:MAG: HD-GYP domain-containing protein [Spirochaetota bacterium]
MIRININLVRQGMTTAGNIYSVDGTLLIPINTTLTGDYIRKLKQEGFDSIYVQNPHIKGLEPFDREIERIKAEATSIIHRECADIRSDKKLNLSCIYNISEMIVDCVLSNRNLLIHLSDIRAHNDYTFGHSVNVCMLSIMTGIKMRYNNTQLHELSVGALLHDIGKLLIPDEILSKPSKLVGDDWKIMRQHVTLGYEIVMEKTGNVSPRSGNIILQHHENYNCRGYPAGLCSDEIDEYAKITAVADMYDAITADRTYRPASYHHDAYHSILAAKGVRFDQEIVDVFINNVAKYPIGSVILLSTFETGTVIESFAETQDQPVVKVIADEYRRSLAGNGRIIDATLF